MTIRPTAFALLALVAPAFSDHVAAQPDPSFQARCGEVRGAMTGLKRREEDELVTIEVVGRLELVQQGAGLVYLALCGPPHPRVLCVTYATNDRQVGDRVVVVGSIVPRGPEFVQLDPCLHRLPTPEDKDEPR